MFVFDWINSLICVKGKKEEEKQLLPKLEDASSKANPYNFLSVPCTVSWCSKEGFVVNAKQSMDGQSCYAVGLLSCYEQPMQQFLHAMLNVNPKQELGLGMSIIEVPQMKTVRLIVSTMRDNDISPIFHRLVHKVSSGLVLVLLAEMDQHQREWMACMEHSIKSVGKKAIFVHLVPAQTIPLEMQQIKHQVAMDANTSTNAYKLVANELGAHYFVENDQGTIDVKLTNDLLSKVQIESKTCDLERQTAQAICSVLAQVLPNSKVPHFESFAAHAKHKIDATPQIELSRFLNPNSFFSSTFPCINLECRGTDKLFIHILVPGYESNDVKVKFVDTKVIVSGAQSNNPYLQKTNNEFVIEHTFCRELDLKKKWQPVKREPNAGIITIECKVPEVKHEQVLVE